MNGIAGRLLIASPYLTDGHFFRSVIYIIRHDEEGAFGLVLNRVSDHTLEELFADRLGHVPRREDQIYLGGPVEGPLMALHTLAGLGEPCGPDVVQMDCGQADDGQIGDGFAWAAGEAAGDPGSSPLWVTADDDHLLLLVDRTDVQVRFIARYSGWGPGQLDNELEQGGWLVGAPDWKVIFADHDSMWESVIKKLGRDIIADIVCAPPASDPQWN
jgi:putative transcriptional regulator